MTIAELFVNLGVKGANATGKALGAIDKGLGEIASSSLAAKAAVAGVIFGMERLTGFASQVGMDLYKFGISTGLSTTELQKWQYSAMRFDVSASDMAGAIQNVQNAMTEMKLTGNAPAGLGLLASKVGFDTKRIDDTYYVMGKLEQFAKSVPPDIAKNVLQSFGVGGNNMLTMLRVVNRDVDKINNKDIITQKQIKQLADINKAWKDFWFSLRTMGVKLVAEEGLGAVTELGEAFKALKDGGNYVIDLTQKFSGLKYAIMAIGIALGLAFAPLTTLITGLVFLLGEYQKYKEGKDGVFKSITGNIDASNEKDLGAKEKKGMDDAEKTAKSNYESSPAHLEYLKSHGMEPPKKPEEPGVLGRMLDYFGMMGADNAGVGKSAMTDEEKAQSILPKMPTATAPTAPNNVSQNNVFNIDGSQSPKETADAVQKEVSRAHRQLSSQAGGY